MPGIGDVRVNLIADVASFVTNVQKGSKALAGFGKDAARIVSDIDRMIGMFGRKATLKITAPLVGLAAAAVNAADPTKRVFNELERLGLQAGKALEPIGDILISLFDRALPTIQSAVGGLRELSNRFAALPPATQEMAIGAAAAVAAIGPLAIVLSSLTFAAKPAAAALSFVFGASSGLIKSTIGLAKSSIVALSEWAMSWWGNSAKVGTAIGLTLKNITLLGTALVSFEFGRWAYDQFKFVQQGAAFVVKWIFDKVDEAKWVFKSAVNSIVELFDGLWAKVKQGSGAALGTFTASLWQIPSGLRAIIGITDDALVMMGSKAEELMQSSSNAADEWLEKQKQINKELQDDLKMNADVLSATLAEIDRDFGDRQWKGKGFLQFVAGDIKLIGDYADDSADSLERLANQGLMTVDDWYQKLIDSANELMSVGPAPFIATKRESNAAAEQMEKVGKFYADLREQAQQIRFEVYPEEKARSDIARIRLLQSELELIGQGDLLPDDVVNAKIRKIMDELDKLKKKTSDTFRGKMADAVADFSHTATEQVLDFIFESKRGVGDLLKSFARMAVGTGLQQLVMGPAFSALGAAIRGSAHGDAFMGGARLYAYAHGGVTNGPEIFPTRGGWGLRGEKGSEAVMPLTRIGQDLGVKAVTSPVVINVIDRRQMGNDVQVSESTTAGGHRQIDILIADTVDRRLASGRFDSTLNRVFGVRRRGA